jgi:hypothetical protein
MPSILTPASGLIAPPTDAAPRRAGMKALVIGSFAWIVLVSSAAWVMNKYSPHPESFTPAMSATVALPAAEPPATAEPALYFTNPFDRSEVFEFPPGTSRAEARAAVAEFLIDRARGRLSHFQHVTRVAEVGAVQVGEMGAER